MQRGRGKKKDLAHLEFSKRAEPLENLLHWRREHLKKRRIKNLIRRGHVPEATTKLPHPAFFEKSRSKSRPIETYALEIETHALEEQEHESINNQEEKTRQHLASMCSRESVNHQGEGKEKEKPQQSRESRSRPSSPWHRRQWWSCRRRHYPPSPPLRPVPGPCLLRPRSVHSPRTRIRRDFARFWCRGDKRRLVGGVREGEAARGLRIAHNSPSLSSPLRRRSGQRTGLAVSSRASAMRWAGGFERRGGQRWSGSYRLHSVGWPLFWTSSHCQVCLGCCVLTDTPFAHEKQKENARKTRGKWFLFFFILFFMKELSFYFIFYEKNLLFL